MERQINRFIDVFWSKGHDINETVKNHFKIAIDRRNILTERLGKNLSIAPERDCSIYPDILPLSFRKMISLGKYEYTYEDFDIHNPRHYEIIFSREFGKYCLNHGIDHPEDFKEKFISTEAEKWKKRVNQVTDPKQQIVIEKYLDYLSGNSQSRPIKPPYESLRRVYAFVCIMAVKNDVEEMKENVKAGKKIFKEYLKKMFPDISENTLHDSIKYGYKNELCFYQYFEKCKVEYHEDFEYAEKIYPEYFPLNEG